MPAIYNLRSILIFCAQYGIDVGDFSKTIYWLQRAMIRRGRDVERIFGGGVPGQDGGGFSG
jgi:hypothetical protein